MTERRDPGVASFLRKSLIVRTATLSPAGNPDIIPLYFVGVNGRIYMGTRGESPTVRDLRAHPDVVLLFHGEQWRGPARVLRLRGRATFTTERRAFAGVYARFALKYWFSPGALWNTVRNLPKLMMDRRYKAERAGQGGLIEVIPETFRFFELPH